MQNLSDKQITQLVKKALKAQTETDSVEFKDARGGLPDELWKSITAFSNKHSGGGVIVFGVQESEEKRYFKVVHLPSIHELQERASTYYNDRIVNGDRPNYRILELENEQLLFMVINNIQEEKKPCFDQKHGMDRGAYIRDGNTDRPITDDELRHFIRNSSAYKYDITALHDVSIDELNKDKIQGALREMSIRTGRQNVNNDVTDTVLLNTRIAVMDKKILRPTLAGALIFVSNEALNRNPFDRYVIRCIKYAGSTPATEITDSQDIAGSLDKQIDSMNSFVLRNISRRATIEGTKRIERFEYPEEAIREVIANAVIHRDYTITETYTQIRIFSDRIEVVNPGNLPPGVTVDNIRDMQFSRNTAIASLMKDLTYLEEYGRGIDLVFFTMQQLGLPRPIFRNTANMFTVTLLGSKFSSLTQRQLSVWQIILNRSRVSAKIISEQIGISRPPVVSDINKLIELGLVASIGSGAHVIYEIGTSF